MICREFPCASNETYREKVRSDLKGYIGAKVIKEVREFFILPRNHSTTARRCVLGSRVLGSGRLVYFSLLMRQRKLKR